jgi:3-deoxy-D-manno-octulosonate cytidylyltransferase
MVRGPSTTLRGVPVTAVIPVRYGSTRFPGKPLVNILGRPLMRWVHDAALAAKRIDRVLLATDDDRIAAVAADFGATVVRTSAKPRNGTERVAEIMRADARKDELWLNVQGDEPLLEGDDLDVLVEALTQDPLCAAATLAVPLPAELAADPNAVKVVRAVNGDALYFSRSNIPHRRANTNVGSLLHVGVYALRRDVLDRYADWEAAALEECESLEQLRLLEHGERMRVVLRDGLKVGVNTPDDLPAVEVVLAARGRRG